MSQCAPAIKCTLTTLTKVDVRSDARTCDNSTLPSTVTRLKRLVKFCNTGRHMQHTRNETQLHFLPIPA